MVSAEWSSIIDVTYFDSIKLDYLITEEVYYIHLEEKLKKSSLDWSLDNDGSETTLKIMKKYRNKVGFS